MRMMVLCVLLAWHGSVVAKEEVDLGAPFIGFGTNVGSIPFETELGSSEWQTGTWSLAAGMALSLGIDHDIGRLGGHIEFGPRVTFLPEEEVLTGFSILGCADIMWRPQHHVMLGPSVCVEAYEPVLEDSALTPSVTGLVGISVMTPFFIGDTTELSPRLFMAMAPGFHEGRLIIIPSIALGIDVDTLFGPAPTL